MAVFVKAYSYQNYGIPGHPMAQLYVKTQGLPWCEDSGPGEIMFSSWGGVSDWHGQAKFEGAFPTMILSSSYAFAASCV